MQDGDLTQSESRKSNIGWMINLELLQWEHLYSRQFGATPANGLSVRSSAGPSLARKMSKL